MCRRVSPKFWLLSFCLLLLWGCDGNKTPTNKLNSDLDEYELRGKVRSVLIQSYNVGQSQLSSKDSVVEVKGAHLINFNNDGLITDSTYFFVTGEVQYRETFDRDTKGYLKEVITKDINGKSLSKALYKNDTLGNPKEVTLTGLDGKMARKFTHKYDSAGNLVEYKSYNANAELNSTVIYTYDFIKHTKFQTRTSASGEIQSEVGFKTDSANLVIEQNITSPNLEGVISLTYRYIFDSHGNWIEKSEKTNSGDVHLEGRFSKRTITYY